MMTISPCDRHFRSAAAALDKAKENALGATRQCIEQAVRDLTRACSSFKDPEIAVMKAGLQKGIESCDTICMGETVRHYVSIIDRSAMDFARPTPELLILLAAINLADAIGDWAMDRLECAYANTVRTRVLASEILSQSRST